MKNHTTKITHQLRRLEHPRRHDDLPLRIYCLRLQIFRAVEARLHRQPSTARHLDTYRSRLTRIPRLTKHNLRRQRIERKVQAVRVGGLHVLQAVVDGGADVVLVDGVRVYTDARGEIIAEAVDIWDERGRCGE